jgi:propanol-preferring alcohol dehydrogenase
MKALFLSGIHRVEPGSTFLQQQEVPTPEPKPDEVLIRVSVCGVCHTELDEIEGRTPPPVFPVIPGHQVVGEIVGAGSAATVRRAGERVGVAWIASACGRCPACHSGNENLCPSFQATGRDVHGGYAEYLTARETFVHLIPPVFDDAEAAPLLCAGAIGYRSLRLSGLLNGQTLGLTGFGASAHLVLTMVRHQFPASPVYVFARSEEERSFARDLGAAWTGEAGETPPAQPNAIIDTTPVWTPVREALRVLAPGGRLVINAIRKESADRQVLQEIDYPTHLWMEKEIKSVANVTRRDVREFLALAAEIPLRPMVEEYPLDAAQDALLSLKHRHVRGAKVLRVSASHSRTPDT